MSAMNTLENFKTVLQKSSKVVILTGAGVSAESGVPTFRGAGGLWRTFNVTDLATPRAFQRDPSLVWEFYHYRRDVMGTKVFNRAHKAIAEYQKLYPNKVTLVTQNIDGLHAAAGSQQVIEMHGSLWKTRCTKCGDVKSNREMPMTPALVGSGSPDGMKKTGSFTLDQLPTCQLCQGLLRPHVVWFEESLDPDIMEDIELKLSECNLLIVAGTSSVVYPAARFAPMVKSAGGVVAEFNLERTPNTDLSHFSFSGQAGDLLPEALGVKVE